MLMDENLPEQRKDGGQSEEWERQTTLMKAERQISQFQKNYPKNIFIPIIEYLADIGLQAQYEKTVGTREEFQGKNVVSLSLIYQLVTQPWFLRHVNKKHLEANISNKILMNSKIKKKLFHLKVARILLQSQADSPKQFKKLVSRKANSIALEIEENDQLFDHPSSVIYLLTLFLAILKNSFPSNIYSFKNLNDSLDSQNSNSSQYFQNSKEQFKNLTKNIIITLTKMKAPSSALHELETKVRDIILQRANQIKHKFDLIEGAPNWEYFLELVVNRCIRNKIEGNKMTNSLLNQWILEFKQKSSQTIFRTQPMDQNINYLNQMKEFKPIILVMPPQLVKQNF